VPAAAPLAAGGKEAFFSAELSPNSNVVQER